MGGAITVVVLAAGFAGFVWWKLQPHSDPRPLPEPLIALDSEEGRRSLEEASASADYQPLRDAFEPQHLVSYCGVASAAAALRAMGSDTTQGTFFNGETDDVRSRFQVMFGGMSLSDLAGLLRAHGADVRLHHADASSVEAFREVVDENLGTEGDYVLVNYQREVLDQGRVGHISPLAAYNGETDRVLILDTAAHKYPPTWVPLDLLFAAMATTDPSTGKTRGFVEVGQKRAD